MTKVCLLVVSIACMTIFLLESPASAQQTPVNYLGIDFNPIPTATSYNYNWSDGTMTVGTASARVSSAQSVLQNNVSDPTPPDPNGLRNIYRYRTTGKVAARDEERCFLSSLSALTGYPICLSDGTLTYGDMVMYTLRGDTLDQLTNLQTDYYVEHGCFGGGSPRFQIVVTNATGEQNIFGLSRNSALRLWIALRQARGWVLSSTASDAAGYSLMIPLNFGDTRGTFYNTYSGAENACANMPRLHHHFAIWLSN